MIQAGIEASKKEQALDIIKKQLEDIKNGAVSEQEFQQTKALMSNGLRSIVDSPIECISFDFANLYLSMEQSVAERIQSMEEITVNDVQDVAKEVSIDVIYCLKGGDQ
jgi:predicted Zn-dependent peptidase